MVRSHKNRLVCHMNKRKREEETTTVNAFKSIANDDDVVYIPVLQCPILEFDPRDELLNRQFL